jgi:RNA recognition motif-containing protein
MDQDWQRSTTHHHQRNKKRVYVGNLIYVNDLSTQESLLRNLFASSAIPTKDIEIIPLKKPLGKCYALVECDVNNAIKCLNGVLFQGERIVVKAEQKQNSNHQGKSSRRKNAMSSFGGGGWSHPKTNTRNQNHNQDKSYNKNASSKATNASSHHDTMVQTFQRLDIQNDTHLNGNDDNINFYQRKEQSIQSLMKEYGEYDPNYEKMKQQQQQPSVDSTRVESNIETKQRNKNDFFFKCKQPLSELLQDYGEYDPDYEKMKQQRLISSTLLQHQTPQKEGGDHEGMLTTHGPIHVQIVSFGYKYGTPKQGYWSHSNPMSALDCRYLPRCHFSLAKFSGLHYKVKKSMTRRNGYTHDPSKHMEDHPNDEDKRSIEQEIGGNDNELVAKAKEVAQNILSCVIDAMQDGGHGYAFPLEMTIYVGSEYGRHRSVVLVETIAVQIRQLLRRNEGGKVIEPVSVSTRHRDVDLNHKDEEAFGKDLEREHKIELKRKKKQERLEASNLYVSEW